MRHSLIIIPTDDLNDICLMLAMQTNLTVLYEIMSSLTQLKSSVLLPIIQMCM
jgi:hypothetical protein